MVVNKVMASQPMCVARLRDHAVSLYSNPQKDRVATEALNATPLPPPYRVPVEQKENPAVKEKLLETNAATSNCTSTGSVDDINVSTVAATATAQSMNNYFESSGWEMVHEEPIVDIFMEDIPQVAGNKSYSDATLYGNSNKVNEFVQHSSSTSDAKPPPSSSPQSLPVDSGVVRTYTPNTISSDEEHTASDDDDDSIGSLRPKKKHKFNAPDLFKEQWKNPRRATVSY